MAIPLHFCRSFGHQRAHQLGRSKEGKCAALQKCDRESSAHFRPLCSYALRFSRHSVVVQPAPNELVGIRAFTFETDLARQLD